MATEKKISITADASSTSVNEGSEGKYNKHAIFSCEGIILSHLMSSRRGTRFLKTDSVRSLKV